MKLLSYSSSNLLLFFLLLIAIIELQPWLSPYLTQRGQVSGQQIRRNRPSSTTLRPRPKPARRRRPPPRRRKKGEEPRLNCYTCFANFDRIPLTVFNPVEHIYTNLCYNPGQNTTMADKEYLTKCSPATKYCMVDVTRMNNVLLQVDRRCGGATCRKTCLAQGYGLLRETCTFCCGGKVTEDEPEFDEELHATYTCPNELH